MRRRKGEGATMSLDDQLAEILTSLGVTMETVGTADRDARVERAAWAPGATAAGREERQRPVNNDDWLDDWGDEPEREEVAPADISLFQTSREHYGVFYRLDLVAGA